MSPEDWQAVDEGRLILGGDLINLDETHKDWRCRDCGHEWGDRFDQRLAEVIRSFEEKAAHQDALAAQRGMIDAIVRQDGWVTCPHCRSNFATYAKMSWDGEKHKSCRTRLRLINAAVPRA